MQLNFNTKWIAATLIQLVQLALVAIPVTVSIQAFALGFGVNIHTGGGSQSENQKIADLLKSRNLKSARMDYFPGNDVTLLRDQISKINANGGSVQVSLQVSYQWDNSCNQDLSYVEQDSYQQAYDGVIKLKDLVNDFELLNEVSLRSELLPEVPYNSAGTNSQVFDGKRCYKTITAVLRGMSRAVRDVRVNSGKPLRAILGAVGRDFALLSYMEQNGVLFDVVGYHIYPTENQASLLNDNWFGAGGPLNQLAKFNRPVTINEFHCGEIYSDSYENQSGAPLTESCLRSMKKHLKDLTNQKIANLESILAYELLDETNKSGPEGKFGLMYNLATPKVNLFILTAYSGGYLFSEEQKEITNRGLMTDSEIANYKSAAGSAQPPSGALTLNSITSNQYVTYLYYLICGRAPDTGGLNAYVKSLKNGTSKTNVQMSFINSDEFLNRLRAENYTPAPQTDMLSNGQFVQNLFVVLLNRMPDSGGLQGYVSRLNNGESRSSIVREMMSSAEYLATYPNARR